MFICASMYRFFLFFNNKKSMLILNFLPSPHTPQKKKNKKNLSVFFIP